MKNQKGVTLIVLAATIVIMGIIIGSVSYHSIASMKMRSYYNMCSDIEILDEKIALYYLQNGTLPIEEETKSIYEIVPDYAIDNVNYNPNNSGNLQKIDLTKLENLTLTYTEYYIDETSHTIYSASGMEVGEEMYFTVPLDYEKVDLDLYQNIVSDEAE